MPGQFPKRRADGSFDLVVSFRVPNDRLQRWLGEWVEQNVTWSRKWESAGRIEIEVVEFATDFFAPPALERGSDGTTSIRLRVKPDSTLWKDWYAKLTDDVMTTFGDDVELVGVVSE